MTVTEFNGIITQNYKSLKPAALKLTKSSEEANDLVQETLLKAMRNMDKFREGTNIKAWLYTIMRNTFITHYHRIIKRKTFVETADDLSYLQSTHIGTEENKGALNLDEEMVLNQIHALPEMYQYPFNQYYVGYKYQEIADDMGIPLGTVKNRIHVARKLLKDRIEYMCN